MRKSLVANLATSLIVFVLAYQISVAQGLVEGKEINLRETLKTRSLKLSEMSGSQDGTVGYCNTLLSELKNNDSRLIVLKPIVSKETFDLAFGEKEKSQCPALELNRHVQLLQRVRYDWWLSLPENEKDMYATYWYGTKRPKLFELPGFDGAFIFYAEAYFSEEVASRPPRVGSENIRFGYANSPGNSARYDLYDLRACKWLGGSAVHEAKNYFTGDALSNKSALFKYGEEFIVADLYTNNAGSEELTLQLNRFRPRSSRPVQRACTFTTN